MKKHNKSAFHFVPLGLLFSSCIKNEANQIFIVNNGLTNARDSLMNGKPYKILCVVNLNKTHNWKKGVSNWINVTFEDSGKPYRADHFAFGFKSRNLKDILNFQFTLLGSDAKKIEFVDNEKKSQHFEFQNRRFKMIRINRSKYNKKIKTIR